MASVLAAAALGAVSLGVLSAPAGAVTAGGPCPGQAPSAAGVHVGVIQANLDHWFELPEGYEFKYVARGTDLSVEFWYVGWDGNCYLGGGSFGGHIERGDFGVGPCQCYLHFVGQRGVFRLTGTK